MNDERKRSGRIALAVCLLGACFWCAADRQPLAGEMAYHARPCCRPNHHLHTGCRSSRHHQPGKCEHPTRLPGIPSQHTDTFRLRIEQGALTPDPNWVSRYNPYNTTGIIIGNDQGNGLLTAVRVIGDNEIERLWQIELHTSARPVIVSDREVVYANDFVDGRDHLVVLDLMTGEEILRVPTPATRATIATSVIRPCPDISWTNRL